MSARSTTGSASTGDPRNEEVRIRELAPGDDAAVERFYRQLSPESSYTRFFSASPDAYRAITRDPSRRITLLAESGGTLVAVAECCIDGADPTRAEVAFAVLDRAQHHGLASRLLREVRRVAARRAIRTLTAEVLATNQPMMHVFWSAGLPVQSRLRDGVYDVTLDLDEPPG